MVRIVTVFVLFFAIFQRVLSIRPFDFLRKPDFLLHLSYNYLYLLIIVHKTFTAPSQIERHQPLLRSPEANPLMAICIPS